MPDYEQLAIDFSEAAKKATAEGFPPYMEAAIMGVVKSMIDATKERDAIKRERADLRAALAELVVLKDMKDASPLGLGGGPDYEMRKPAAWEAARAVLARLAAKA